LNGAESSADAQAQVTATIAVMREANDKHQSVPMLGQVKVLRAGKQQQATADAEHFSEGNGKTHNLEGIDLFVAPERPQRAERDS
jgi:hypothetical protein